MRKLFLLALWTFCTLDVLAQQPTYSSLMRHFQGDGQKSRDSLQRYQDHVRVLAREGRWLDILRTDRFDTLQEINLSNLDIEELPEVLLGADSLRRLLVNGNQVRKLPRWLKKLPKLARIEWNDNEVGGRKMTWGKLPYLKSLELEGNGQRKLKTLRKSKDITRLSIARNDFRSIPIRALKRNDSLKILEVSKNPNLVLGPDRYRQLDMVEILKVHACSLRTYHPSLYEMSNLTDLQFVDNQLQQIPPGINRLTRLKKLSFYKNILTTLPTEIFELDSLEIIDLYYNELTVVPTEIEQWQRLQILYLSNNRLYDLPETLGNLGELRELYLHHNRLSALPASLDQLEHIRTLRIDHNYLVEFPQQILSYRELGYLDISANDIPSLPRNFEASFPKLYLFNYQENPIDFEEEGQEFLAQMVHSMMKKGVVCTPRVEMELIKDNQN